MAIREEWTWQVMYGTRRAFGASGTPGVQRVKHFRDEQAAREFARKMVQAGHTVQAETKVGVEPAKKVRPTAITAWCAAKD
jgi:hypothetical protein